MPGMCTLSSASERGLCVGRVPTVDDLSGWTAQISRPPVVKGGGLDGVQADQIDRSGEDRRSRSLVVGRQNSVFTEKHKKLGGVGGSPSGPTGFKQATFDLIRTHVCQLGAVSARRVPSIRPSASGVSGASSGTPPFPQ